MVGQGCERKQLLMSRIVVGLPRGSRSAIRKRQGEEGQGGPGGSGRGRGEGSVDGDVVD